MKIPDTTIFIQKLQPLIAFFKKYGIFIAPAILFLFFMSLLFFSYTQNPSKKPGNSQGPAPSTTQGSGEGSNGGVPSEVSTEPTASPGSGEMEASEHDLAMWNGEQVSDTTFDGLNATKTTLPDGSTQYSYYSDNTTRPDIIIVKNGIDVFQRTPIQAEMDPTESTPDFVAQGSRFWGANVNTYIYLSKGMAYVGDPSTNEVFEQMTFKPGTLQQFMQYDKDMLHSPQSP